MKRLSLLITVAVVVAGAFFLNSGRTAEIMLTAARAMPISGQDNLFSVTLEIENTGTAKTLISVSSSSAKAINIMNTGHLGAPIVVPENGKGIFAMDGAHLMLMGPDSDFVEGAFIPLTLEFAEYGKVKTRVLNVGDDMGMAGMDHSITTGVQTTPSAQIQLTAEGNLGGRSTEIAVSVENFTFVRAPEDATHIPHEGHGHIYLNGLKIGRLYEQYFTLGAVPPGTYDLTVSLNSNDHQPYIENGKAISHSLAIVHQE